MNNLLSKLSQFFYFHNIHKQITIFSLAEIICQILVSCTCNWILIMRGSLQALHREVVFCLQDGSEGKASALNGWVHKHFCQIMNVDFNFVLYIFLWMKHFISLSLNFMFWKNQWYTANCRNKKNTITHVKWTFNIWFLFLFFKVMLIFLKQYRWKEN